MTFSSSAVRCTQRAHQTIRCTHTRIVLWSVLLWSGVVLTLNVHTPTAVAQSTAQASESASAEPTITTPWSAGMELSANGGVLHDASTIASDHSSQSPLMQSAQAGMYTTWHTTPLDATIALSFARTSALGMHLVQPLGLLRVARRRGTITFSLGIEQSLGVSVAAKPKTGTVADTGSGPGTIGSDTIRIFSQPGLSATSLLPSNIASLVRTSDVVAGIGVHTRRSILQLLTGVRVSDLRRGAWIGMNTDVGIGASSSVMLMLRQQTSSSTIRIPAVSLGVRTAYLHWGAVTPVVPQPSRTKRELPPHLDVTGDTLHLSLYLPNASRAAVMGDATDWRPVAMTRDTQGWWTVSLHGVSPLSRIQLQTDDAPWSPIPGLPTTHDEYGGTVSILTAPSHSSAAVSPVPSAGLAPPASADSSAP